MPLPFYNWSRVAASNATADSTVQWPEGMAPSLVNDSARAMMASTAAFRDDIAGAIVTGGSSTAYTVTSYQVFDTLAHLNGQMIAFTPHATNGATVTLNVDGLGAKPLRPSPGVELYAGTLILGTPYVAVYNNSDAAFYLQNFYGNPYNIPLGSGIDYWGTTAPNSAFVFPTGQAISRTTYAGVFALLGTTWGAGDGSTTFNLPDKRGRVSAAVDNMGGVSAGRFTPALGSAKGTEDHLLAISEMPSHNHGGSTGAADRSLDHLHGASVSGGTLGGILNAGIQGGGTYAGPVGSTAITVSIGGMDRSIDHLHSIGAQGGGSAHNNTQPTIVCNYIIRVL